MTLDEDLIRWARELRHTAKSTGGTLQSLTFPMRFVPGETWSSGTAIEWLGVLIEWVTGKRLEEYMKEKMFDKLGMELGVLSTKVVGGREWEGREVCSECGQGCGEWGVELGHGVSYPFGVGDCAGWDGFV